MYSSILTWNDEKIMTKQIFCFNIQNSMDTYRSRAADIHIVCQLSNLVWSTVCHIHSYEFRQQKILTWRQKIVTQQLNTEVNRWKQVQKHIFELLRHHMILEACCPISRIQITHKDKEFNYASLTHNLIIHQC